MHALLARLPNRVAPQVPPWCGCASGQFHFRVRPSAHAWVAEAQVMMSYLNEETQCCRARDMWCVSASLIRPFQLPRIGRSKALCIRATWSLPRSATHK